MFLLNTAFIDVSLLVGIVAIVIVRSYTSPSNYAKANRVEHVNKLETVQIKGQQSYIYPKIILNTCFFYSAIFLVVVIISYYDYFTA